MVDLFQRHIDAEAGGDLETTMATMTDDPYVNHVLVEAVFGGKQSSAPMPRVQTAHNWRVQERRLRY